jgi:phthalate 4,5-cis-dihydrodiol dehydrogenase
MISKLKVGVVGLGRAFSLMLPAFSEDPRVELVAAADPRAEARAQFKADFGGDVFDSAEELCARSGIDVVYIATPQQFHAANAIVAASFGKHILVEKPMAVSLEECRAMIAAAAKAGVRLIVGHSHSFDAPILKARQIIDSGVLGPVRMIAALNYTDFVYRPRRPEELDTSTGGGVVFNQAPHQIDVVRLLAGSPVRTVRASIGSWDSARPVEGAYTCLLRFEDGVFATVTYSGYAHFDSDEFMNWIGEAGTRKGPGNYGVARRTLAADEIGLKNSRNYGGDEFKRLSTPDAHPHFGVVLVSCERGDLRPMPSGVLIYDDAGRRTEQLAAPRVPRVEVIDELVDVVVKNRPPRHGGDWAMATMEVCLAMRRSAAEQREIVVASGA